jgi:hypothetical protein
LRKKTFFGAHLPKLLYHIPCNSVIIREGGEFRRDEISWLIDSHVVKENGNFHSN